MLSTGRVPGPTVRTPPGPSSHPGRGRRRPPPAPHPTDPGAAHVTDRLPSPGRPPGMVAPGLARDPGAEPRRTAARGGPHGGAGAHRRRPHRRDHHRRRRPPALLRHRPGGRAGDRRVLPRVHPHLAVVLPAGQAPAPDSRRAVRAQRHPRPRADPPPGERRRVLRRRPGPAPHRRGHGEGPRARHRRARPHRADRARRSLPRGADRVRRGQAHGRRRPPPHRRDRRGERRGRSVLAARRDPAARLPRGAGGVARGRPHPPLAAVLKRSVATLVEPTLATVVFHEALDEGSPPGTTSWPSTRR